MPGGESSDAGRQGVGGDASEVADPDGVDVAGLDEGVDRRATDAEGLGCFLWGEQDALGHRALRLRRRRLFEPFSDMLTESAE
jgi:hypothetical protein